MFETEKKLKDGIRSLQVENGMLITKINDYMYAYNDLKKQNEALKEELVRCYRIHDLFNSMPEQFKELESLKDENKKRKEQIEFLKKEYNELRELWIATDKVNRIYEKKIQELYSENEALKSKELKDTEKICDGVNSELLNLCTKLSDENMLLIHKQPIIRESEIEPKEKKEELIVKPTYFSMDEKHKCLDLCGIINKETKIGSLSCQYCTSCVESNIEEQWVKCSKRPEGKPQPNKPEKRDKFGVVSKFEDNACKLCIYKEDNIENNAVCDNCSDVNDFDEYYSSK